MIYTVVKENNLIPSIDTNSDIDFAIIVSHCKKSLKEPTWNRSWSTR